MSRQSELTSECLALLADMTTYAVQGFGIELGQAKVGDLDDLEFIREQLTAVHKYLLLHRPETLQEAYKK